MNYNIICSPFCVIAEHSTYLTAFVSFASFSPCSCVIGFCEDGSLLIAKHGKGHYIYTGLSFFREFPAGVSGAYRLFANMLSIGKDDIKTDSKLND